MRIVFFTESLFPLVDGVSHTLGHLFAALEDNGIEFRVYAPFVPPPDVSWHSRVRRVRSFTFPLYRDYRVSLPGGRRVAAEIDEFHPDIVHVVSPTPMAIWAQRYARQQGIPAVASFHTHFVSYFRYYGVPALESAGWRGLRWFYRRSKRVSLTEAGIEAREASLVMEPSNTVELDVERAQFAENALRYEAELTFLNAHIKTLLAALQG